jgi:glucosamine--fructose-6-phosphate aminotransferase (isomerizing)
MCGIIGIIRIPDNVVPDMISGLQRLEYRGYDSAGLSVLDDSGSLQRRRTSGKVSALGDVTTKNPLSGRIGIAHTRWATHGKPLEHNAHPHSSASVSLVHNGIIENYMALKQTLIGQGHVFLSETDSEVIVHLLEEALRQGHSPQNALAWAVPQLHGAFAIVALFAEDENHLYGSVKGSPLVLGLSEGAGYVASDALAFAPYTSRALYLQDGDLFTLAAGEAVITDEKGAPVTRPVTILPPSVAAVDRGPYRHFMAKEIDEQPTVTASTLRSFWDPIHETIIMEEAPPNPGTIEIIACGTSYFAGMVGQAWFEAAGIPTQVHIASEFRYRPYFPDKNKLSVFISQSGETADTLAALKHIHALGGRSLAIVNVAGSSLNRLAHHTLLTKAGPEIGVASTKAFTTQLMTLAALSLFWGERDGDNVQDLVSVPGWMRHVLNVISPYQELAHGIFRQAQSALFIGRGASYAVALEGALKLKELSYIHAEALAAGELKHGSIALVDEHLPVVALAPSDALFEKTASNIEEIAARQGQLIILTDTKGSGRLRPFAHTLITLPETTPLSMPLIYTLPLQLLAYHVALARGTDIDQPRNLAKSVTVE